jgi:hypothetical protein
VRQLSIVLAPETVLLALASSILHELGHAAAARKLGCRHGDLGFGLYLVFPVLYMELDDAWRLPRRDRAIIDAAGLYAQLLFALAIAGVATLWHPLLPAALGLMILTVTSLLANLNPLFRFDGYWLISDLLGIPNLRRASMATAARAWRYVSRRLARTEGASAAPVFAPELAPRMAALLLLYGVASVGFFVEYFGRLFLALPTYAVKVYPSLALGKLRVARYALEQMDVPRAATALLTLIPPTSLLVGLGVTVGMMVVRAWRVGGRALRERART